MTTIDPDSCYRALRARDRRFDGLFFVGVSTTGIYCRPVCPARTPAASSCTFFSHAASAEKAGFRACFRCRPEVAPGRGTVDAIGELVRRALQRIEGGALDAGSARDLAQSLGVSERHLRRAFVQELGVSPIEVAQTQRIAVAKQLLADTDLPIVQIALACGCRSVRRFNAMFQDRFGRPPTAFRRGATRAGIDGIALRLDYRPPLAWQALLEAMAPRAIPGVEVVEGDAVVRSFRLGEAKGVLRATHDASRLAVLVRVWLDEPALAIASVRSAARRWLDLDAHPSAIASSLEADPMLAASMTRRPGLRVLGAFDPFAAAVRVVLGQQITVTAASTISGRMVRRFGERLASPFPSVTHLFPSPDQLAAATPAAIAELGLPKARAAAVHAFAAFTQSGGLERLSDSDHDACVATLRGLPGFGPWTAEAIAMRVMRHPDAFPAGDLVLQKAAGQPTAAALRRRAEPWRPWRAYAAAHLLHAHATAGRAASTAPHEPQPTRSRARS